MQFQPAIRQLILFVLFFLTSTFAWSVVAYHPGLRLIHPLSLSRLATTKPPLSERDDKICLAEANYLKLGLERADPTQFLAVLFSLPSITDNNCNHLLFVVQVVAKNSYQSLYLQTISDRAPPQFC